MNKIPTSCKYNRRKRTFCKVTTLFVYSLSDVWTSGRKGKSDTLDMEACRFLIIRFDSLKVRLYRWWNWRHDENQSTYPFNLPPPWFNKKKREKRLHQTDGQMPVPNVRTCTFIYGSRDLFFVVGREMNRKIVCQTGQLYTSLPILTLARFSFTGQMTWDPGPEWRPTFSLSRIFLFFCVPLYTHSYIQEPCGCGMPKEMARRKELELKRTCYLLVP
jgi:hypothetical protein